MGNDGGEREARIARGSYGSIPKRSGHWLDRLPGIDSDIAAMRTKIQLNKAETICCWAASEEINVIAGSTDLRAVPVSTGHTLPGDLPPEIRLRLKLSGLGESSEESWFSRVLCDSDIAGRTGGNAGAAFIDWMAKVASMLAQSSSEHTVLRNLRSVTTLNRRTSASKSMGLKLNKNLSNQPYFAVWKRTD